MSTVRRAINVAGHLAEAEALWYDVRRWPSWIDGFGRVAEVLEPWPQAGGQVVWESNPYGRGRVTERVASMEPGQGQTVNFEDDRMTGRQSVWFSGGAGGGTAVTLEFEYSIRRARPWMFVVDLLFVRRAMADSLGRTLDGFARELGAPGP